MRFASLGSGSRGNALVVESGRTRIMVDCGFGPRDALTRLGRLGLTPSDLSAIAVTHEHSDHIAGVFRLALRHRVSVWMTHGTMAALPSCDGERPQIEIIDNHCRFRIGNLEVHPFPVPHDAREPVQFVFSDGRHRIGVLTDLGSSTPHIEAMLSGCDALVVECNHDMEMLLGGNYPATLKRRIAGRFGHLDNQAAAAILAGLDARRLQHVIAAHLSERNNRPDLARLSLAGALNCDKAWIGVAGQSDGFSWRDLI